MSQKLKVPVEGALLMALELHKHGELVEARSLYDDVLRSSPDHPDALHFLGVANHQLGHSEDAIRNIERSLELAPDNPDAVNNLGNIFRETGRLEEGEEAYRRVLEIAPEHADTLVNLAIVLRDLKKPEEALEKLTYALKLRPDHASAYHNLGNVYRDLGRIGEALSAYKKSAELSPGDDKASISIAGLLYAAERHVEAMDVLREVLARRPGHAIAQHMLAAYSGENTPKRASDRYVRQLFDTFAASFDEALARLDYKAPQLVASRVVDLLGDTGRQYQVLDIGCGTGLCGPLVRPIAKRLIGVDLSPGMLTKAKKRQIYDQLEEAELSEYMNSTPGEFDVVVCVDTFVYFGELSAAFAAASKTLRPQGWLFFTVEQHQSAENKSGFWLRHHGRYSHSNEYLITSLETAGLVVESLDDVILRKESEQPVSGTLAVARKK